MTLKGADYAFYPHPSVAALNAAGIKFVMRYISSSSANDSNGKNLLSNEKSALLNAGIRIGVVAEEGGTRMLGGNSAGIADAQHADAVVKALGMPGIPVYFAADWDATPAQQTAINAYLDGAASVIGHKRVGVYGSYYVCQRALSAGKVSFTWQTLAWSGGQLLPQRNIYQQLGINVGGVNVDLDTSYTTDYGQWPRPGSNPPPPPPPPPPTNPTLSYGDTGSAVKTLQNRLNVWKAYLTVDGDFGLATLAAVDFYQSVFGLTVDGVVGPSTWKAINATPPAGLPIVNSGDHGPAVEYLQKRLNARQGTNLTIDGVFGAGTLSAVKAFQKAKGLVVDGQVGPKTWAALIN